MTARVFVDTNVLVYQFDARAPEKQMRAKIWLDHLWEAHTGLVSFQVLQEFYAIVTRKLQPGLDPETARRVVRALWAWHPVVVDDRITMIAWADQDRFGLSWWDALVVAAARVTGCSYLLTEDLQHDQDLDGLRVVNPFRVTPQNLSSHRSD
jgi:predicted nucleic acid-binding protein